MDEIVEKVDKKHLIRMYGVKEWEDTEDFLKKVAAKKGKLRKGG